tara:strand:+ start:380 stop:1024 length:645 start_codon:yes stop_codon:yes gene_type:complete
MSKLVVTNIETQNIKFDSDTTAFTIGSDGTTTGAGANKTVIIANDTSGGTAAEIAFDLSMDTSYIFQRFIITGMYASHTNDVYARTRRASDNSYYTGSNSYGWAYRYVTSGGTGGSGSNGSTYGRFCGHGFGNVIGEISTYIVDVYNNAVSGSGKETTLHWQRYGISGSDAYCNEDGHVMETATTTTNQWKMYSSAGSSTVTYDGYVHYGFLRS